MLNELVYLKGTEYTNVNAFVMYRPFWMPPGWGLLTSGRIQKCNSGRKASATAPTLPG